MGCPSDEDKAEAEQNAGKYAKFYVEFGAVLKEGLGEDFGNKDRIAKLLRFASTQSDAVSVTFRRLQGAHEGGPGGDLLHHRRHAGRRPEQPAARGLPQEGHRGAVDERPRRRVGAVLPARVRRHAAAVGRQGGVDLSKLQDEEEKAAEQAAERPSGPVLDKLKGSAQDKAQDVRVTTRLVDSPACLVAEDHGMSLQLARMLKQAGQPVPDMKPILEVNADHALVKKLEGSSTSTIWRTSCSTRRCWPRAACRKIRPPTSSASTPCWSDPVSPGRRAPAVELFCRRQSGAAIAGALAWGHDPDPHCRPVFLTAAGPGSCSSVGVGAGISVPVVPGVSIGVGVGSGGVQLGVGAHAGPVGAGRRVNQDGRVTGNVGVGASAPWATVGARRVGGTGTVLYDPSRPPPAPSR